MKIVIEVKQDHYQVRIYTGLVCSATLVFRRKKRLIKCLKEVIKDVSIR